MKVTVRTGNGTPPIEGDEFNNRLVGHLDHDKILGYRGDDKLYGGPNKDTLVGGTGNDFLAGDVKGRIAYADVFVFGENSGKDVIADFDLNRDLLQIAKGMNGIRKPLDVFDHAHQKGKDVVIDLGEGNKITLKNIDLDDLKKHPADHFQITKYLSD